MQVAITGHSAGLGKAIAERFERDGHEVRGFSIEDGYDITTDAGLTKIITESLDCDVFVNCAHDRRRHTMAQVAVLTGIYYHWQDQAKHIVNICSNAPDHPSAKFDPGTTHYRAAKSALDAVSFELSKMRKPCRVSCIRPGWIESQASAVHEAATEKPIELKMDYDEVADLVAYVVERGPAITITAVTFRRTRI